MLRAIVARIPFCAFCPTGGAPRAALFTSSVVAVPPGPVGFTVPRSTFRLRASARTAGVAFTLEPALGALADLVARSPTMVPLSLTAPSKPMSGAPTWILVPGSPKSFSTLPA